MESKILSCIDLVAAKARYHPVCILRFQGHRPMNKTSKRLIRRGRKSNRNKREAFLTACEWLENETKMHTLNVFRDKVKEFEGTDKVSKSSYLKTLLVKHYGNHVSFSNEQGKTTTIYLVDMAKYILETSAKEK